MEIRKVFANNLQRYRKMAQLSQEALAERAGLHRTYIGGIEQRRINVSLKNIGKIADALNIDAALLFMPNEDSNDAKGTSSRRQTRHGQKTSSASAANKYDSTASLFAAANYAQCTCDNGDLAIEPLEIGNIDLAPHILCNLIMEGYRGDDMQKRYREIRYEVISLLKEPSDDSQAELRD